MICYPGLRDPAVSVVMVTHDAWHWIETALKALVDHTPPVYEIVIVDNGSSAETVDALETRVRGARLIRNTDNRGFGPAVNQGVAEARGSVIALLNSDTIVHAGWLPPLLETLTRDPTCGAVAPRVLNLDGTLQEAGAVLARDGRAAKLGDGAPADSPMYRFRRRLDFAGAQCLLVRRAAFLAAGGMDDVYAPAYYEDADLCLAVAQRGLSIVYDARSTVTHVHYGSGGHDTAERMSERNRPIFARRWAHVLADRPPSVEPWRTRSVVEARDALTPARVLFVESSPAELPPEPTLRLTVLPDPATDVDLLLNDGVEVVDRSSDWCQWLEARRYFYDAVVQSDRVSRRLVEALDATQPQAARRIAERLDSAGVIELLVAAGFAEEILRDP